MMMIMMIVSLADSVLLPTGFRNPLYPAAGYAGSRVLETDFLTRQYARLNWTQSGTIDYNMTQWIVDKNNHVVLKIRLSTSTIDYPAYGEVVSGQWGEPGFFDGSNSVASFDTPAGIGVFEEAGQEPVLFVADSANHCVRRVDMSNLRTVTLAGSPLTPGLRDGDGTKAMFKYPTSVGVDASTGQVFVLDNVNMIRMLSITVEQQRTTVVVTTLIQGACRAQRAFLINSLVMREVWCHTDWEAAKIPSENITVWDWNSFCIGHVLTCKAEEDFSFN